LIKRIKNEAFRKYSHVGRSHPANAPTIRVK